MNANKKLKGPWSHRFFIFLLSIVLGVLLFWVLGFLTNDIGSLRGPVLTEIIKNYVDDLFVVRQKSLSTQLDRIRGDIKNKRQQRDILKDSTENLQNTVRQLLDIQKQSLEKGLDFSAENQQTLAESQTVFLENQRRYQAFNSEIGQLTIEQQGLEKDLASVTRQIDGQEKEARQEYDKLRKKHRLKIAALKLVVLVPIFLLSTWLFIKKRGGTYSVIIYALFIAAFVKLLFVVHEHFPTKYFKYIAILIALAVVLKLLVYLLRRLISPKKDWLIKQYQEAYDKNGCPICGKPIRIGPLRYTAGVRGKSMLLAGQGEAGKQEVYTCPACGTRLYEKCGKCEDIRHSLLPFCEHCGAEKAE
jgi:hypothetical protein